MKKEHITAFAAWTIVFLTSVGCEIINNGERLENSKGLDLYWGHRVFHELGRGYVFEFYETQRSDMLHELEFDYQIDDSRKTIEIKLVNKVTQGSCPQFPKPGGGYEDKCVSKGGFYIPEDLISEGNYHFTVQTSAYKIQAEIRFTEEKATLSLPVNHFVSSTIPEVFVAPKDLLYGAIVCDGEQQLRQGLNFIEDLRSLGLKDTVVYNPPLIKVDDENKPLIASWPPDFHSIPFLLTMTADFSTIIDVAKTHFENNALDIYLYSTNGDQARFDSQGVLY